MVVIVHGERRRELTLTSPKPVTSDGIRHVLSETGAHVTSR